MAKKITNLKLKGNMLDNKSLIRRLNVQYRRIFLLVSCLAFKRAQAGYGRAALKDYLRSVRCG